MRHNPAAWEALSQMADLSPHDARDRLLTPTRNGPSS
jgi:hydroxylysine kinase